MKGLFMDWENELIKICLENGIEPILGMSGERLLIVPKMPNEDLKQKIREIVPSELQYKFIEGPKIMTTEGLRMILSYCGVKSAFMKRENHTLNISITSDSPHLTEQDSEVWPVIDKLLTTDAFIEGYEIKVNDKIMATYNRQVEKAIASRTLTIERDVCPSKDDILNLRITLENCKDVSDFINSL
jgi:hypothetical protein